MSVRTIVEFNHDYAYRIEEDVLGFYALLRVALNTGNEGTWDSLRYYGVKRIVQAHHSDDRKVLVNDQEHKVP